MREVAAPLDLVGAEAFLELAHTECSFEAMGVFWLI